ncbi:MAG: prephenate dehydrogenase [Methylophilaceae bacterium]|uniref:prephenate dehydrogenase n=1 Tax=Methylovorus sp. MM2 TaxID=1848038 RepID=UPI0007E0915C|nr:prephenate dehydrogenase/arogenate dehydrogenase family protein [Methylovorus sp. MM2]OAM52719.1 prephenate dehydrogenase [Methylovorus sp. MM2]
MNKLVIFGVGLIGGSLALALKRKHPTLHITGVDRNHKSLDEAIELGVIDSAESHIETALADADMIVIATPVAQTASILASIATHLTPNTIVTDAGSTKSDVVAYAGALGKKISQFVPGHPIAGAEKSGVSSAKADLFDGKNVVLTPIDSTSELALEKVRKLWHDAGALINEMSAQQHDSIFAAVSHLPHLLAFALVEDLAERPDAKQFFDFAASGFRDFTRIAGSSPEMWRDISIANRAALMTELTTYQQQLSNIQTLLQENNGAELQALFERASTVRNTWAENKKIAAQRSSETE